MLFQSNRLRELENIQQALDKSQAIIEFDMDGIILTANQNFLNAMGYTLVEIQGKHHSIFVDESYKNSQEYRHFWRKLGEGQFFQSQFKRIAKGGGTIWIEATYNPIKDIKGKPYKVIKFATDITSQKIKDSDYTGQISAIGKSQAIIQFNMDGTIIDANENFLTVIGYALDEIKGKHHSIFVEPAYRDSQEYPNFWSNLNAGRYDSGEYKRICKDGHEIWIQASYNPIFDLNGKPFKVVKYATDITQDKLKNVDYTGQIDAIKKSQAVIEFKPDGTILTANSLFCNAMGYRLDEIVGKHHRMFVDQATAASREYEEFWQELKDGKFKRRVFKRMRKDGSQIWIQATYNPIFDLNGKVYKVVKFASDMSELMQASTVADEASGKIQSVASAAEEMSASINEIGRSMSQTAGATQEINAVTSQAGIAAERMSETTQQMGQIVEIIESIAGQTNLLALNATIEAARAGEAGKGFAVVANEVKSLAGQTKKATEDVAKEIRTVQEASKSLKSNIDDITKAAETVNQYVASVASAIEEQTAVTREISSNTNATSALVANIAERIQGLSNHKPLD
jgi:methyl-accepting chemotaxis protein